MSATGRKLAIGGLVVGAVTAYLAYLGAATSWQYYVTVDECLADAAALAKDRIRVSGRVAAGTLEIRADRRRADFSLEGTRGVLRVVCSGPLPDNLAEGIDVVVEGRLTPPGATAEQASKTSADAPQVLPRRSRKDSGLLRGDKILTRCAGKYKSRAPAAQ
jgi:cytochrome c-type biogenesis protein CcmE